MSFSEADPQEQIYVFDVASCGDAQRCIEGLPNVGLWLAFFAGGDAPRRDARRRLRHAALPPKSRRDGPRPARDQAIAGASRRRRRLRRQRAVCHHRLEGRNPALRCRWSAAPRDRSQRTTPSGSPQPGWSPACRRPLRHAAGRAFRRSDAGAAVDYPWPRISTGRPCQYSLVDRRPYPIPVADNTLPRRSRGSSPGRTAAPAH